ncbi:MAG: DnaA regulatory inactivator Hda [Pseudomonadota bacterium]
MLKSEQLLLNLRPRPDARLADFAAPAYEELLGAAQHVLARPGSLLYVHGEPGQGRSHLLAALCGEAERQGLGAVLLPLAELYREDPDLLAGLEGQGLIAFDDVGAIAGRAAWEEALFHFFNRARASAGCRLVFSAAFLPAQCGFRLPDLVSRLALAPAWVLALPDDESRQALVEGAARRRDLDLEEEVVRYLVARGPREPGRLLALVALLDQHSLMAGRRLTIPFVRQVLEGGGTA